MTVDDSDPKDPGHPFAGAIARRRAGGGLGSRLGARVIDNLIVLVLAVVIAIPLGAERNLYAIIAVSGLAGFIYFIVFESTRGWTPGKKVMGLQVRGPDVAAMPTMKQSAIRNAFTLLVVLPFVGVLLGLTAYPLIASTIGNSPNQQGIHDRWAGGTRVLRNRR